MGGSLVSSFPLSSWAIVRDRSTLTQIFGTVTGLIYLLQRFFTFCLLLWLAIEFSLLSLNLCVWASGFEHRAYKTINFWEQKDTCLFCCFLLTRSSSLVGCSAHSRYALCIITWLVTCLSICVHLPFRNNNLFLLDENVIISFPSEHSWSSESGDLDSSPVQLLTNCMTLSKWDPFFQSQFQV